jgi:hypothetical protein
MCQTRAKILRLAFNFQPNKKLTFKVKVVFFKKSKKKTFNFLDFLSGQNRPPKLKKSEGVVTSRRGAAARSFFSRFWRNVVEKKEKKKCAPVHASHATWLWNFFPWYMTFKVKVVFFKKSKKKVWLKKECAPGHT